MRFADLTTLRVGGPIADIVEAITESQLVDAIQSGALILGGGSNVLAGDGPHGRVILVRTRGIAAEVDDCSGAMLEVAAGEPWADLVSETVSRGWQGIEALAGIPGLVGASPIQNIGAYGQQVSDTIARVRVYDRTSESVRTVSAADAGFGYRTSRFKREPDRFVVLSVIFQLRPSPHSGPIHYTELAARLGIETGSRAQLREVHDAVITLRRSKGMVLDAADPDTRSAGSFFLNPVVPQTDVPNEYSGPQYRGDDGTVKLSAAWLIEHAGYGRGYTSDTAIDVALSTKHSLAIVTRPGATTSGVLALARELRDGVSSSYGITLEPEPILIGCAL